MFTIAFRLVLKFLMALVFSFIKIVLYAVCGYVVYNCLQVAFDLPIISLSQCYAVAIVYIFFILVLNNVSKVFSNKNYTSDEYETQIIIIFSIIVISGMYQFLQSIF